MSSTNESEVRKLVYDYFAKECDLTPFKWSKLNVSSYS